jgi:hypothetical protein
LMHWCIGQGVNHSSTKIAVLGERTEVEWGCLMQLVMQFQCSCILRFHGHLNLHLQQLHLHLGWLKRHFASKNWRRWKKTPQLQQLQCLLWLLRIPQSPRLCWCCQHAAHAMVLTGWYCSGACWKKHAPLLGVHLSPALRAASSSFQNSA